MRASDAFAAAFAAASKIGARPEGDAQRRGARDMAARLETLGAENKRLLQRAIAVQSRVIETIAAAALPRAAAPVYGAAGRQPAAAAGAFLLTARPACPVPPRAAAGSGRSPAPAPRCG